MINVFLVCFHSESFEIFEPFLGSIRISPGQVLVIGTISYQKKIFQSILKRNEKVRIGQLYSVCSTESILHSKLTRNLQLHLMCSTSSTTVKHGTEQGKGRNETNGLLYFSAVLLKRKIILLKDKIIPL